MADEKQDYSDIVNQFGPGELAPFEGDPTKSDVDVQKDVKKSLEKLVTDLTKIDLYPRRYEVIQSRLQRFYYRGDQHLQLWGDKNLDPSFHRSGLYDDYGSEEGTSDSQQHTINLYQQCARTLIASLTQSIPGVKFMPQSPDSPQDIATSNAAEKLKTLIERNNDMDGILKQAARLMWTDGRIGFYTNFVTNGQKFGFKGENESDPKGQEVAKVFGVLETKVPITSDCQDEFPYLSLAYEISLEEAKARFPKYAAKLKPGTAGAGEDEWDRMARIGVKQGTQLLSQSSDAFTNSITYQQVWIRNWSYLKIDDRQIREALFSQFPKGVVVQFCGKTFVGCRAECMDDHWHIARPVPGDGQNTPSLGQSVVEIQNIYNNLTGLRVRTYEFGIPSMWFDPDVVDEGQLNVQSSDPGHWHPVKENRNAQPGSKIADAFYSEPLSQISPDMGEWMQELAGPILQNMTGLQPSIFGGADESNETASGIAQLRATSLAQLGPAWSALKYAYACIMKQAVKCAAYRGDDISTVLPKGKKKETINVSKADLQGNIHCFPDQTEGLPMTLDQKSAALELLVQSSATIPALQEVLADPTNIELMREYSGLDDLKIPGADARQKQLLEIQELMDSVPMPTPQLETWKKMNEVAKQQGHPQIPKPADSVLYQPSVPVDNDYDDHNTEWETVKEWVNSSEGQEAKEDDPDGFLNVRLHGLMHKQQVDLLAQQAQQAAQPNKPPSESINFKDLPPEGQSQLAARAGIQINPSAPTPEAPAAPPVKPPTKEVTTNDLTQATETKYKDLPVDPNEV